MTESATRVEATARALSVDWATKKILCGRDGLKKAEEFEFGFGFEFEFEFEIEIFSLSSIFVVGSVDIFWKRVPAMELRRVLWEVSSRAG